LGVSQKFAIQIREEVSNWPNLQFIFYFQNTLNLHVKHRLATSAICYSFIYDQVCE
jgi:hypothetical protein